MQNKNRNIFKEHWPLCKRELPALIFLCIVQTVLNFNFPLYMRLVSPLNIVVAATVSIACMLMCFYIFSSPEKYTPLFEVEFLDDFPNQAFFKNIFRSGMLVIYHATFFYMWYLDYHHVYNMWYAIWYAHMITFFILLHRAAGRYKNAQS